MRTFVEYYRRSIQPQIEMIDIFLKTEQPPYDKAAVAEVLGLSAEALTARMQKEHLAYITKGIFFRLLAEGENSLGGMLKRAVACGLPERYTPETAAYVFGLPLAAVREAAEKTDCSSFSEETLPVLFSEIMLCENTRSYVSAAAVFSSVRSSASAIAKGMAVPGARDVMTFPSTTTSSVSGAAPISLSSMPG